MKKQLLAIVILVALQVGLLLGSLALVISLRSDCSFIAGQFDEAQCSSDANLTTVPLAIFIIFPPILAKLLLDKLKQPISWKKIIVLHALIALVVWWTLVVMDEPHCGCGG